jgi:hypothetical protein
LSSAPIEHVPWSYAQGSPTFTALHSSIVMIFGLGGFAGPGGFECVGP